MRRNRLAPANPLFLGVECGGTKTTVLLADANNKILAQKKLGPANLRLMSDRNLKALFASIKKELPGPSAVAIGMAGARTEKDRARIRQAAGQIWRGIPCLATNDLETGLMAADCGGPSNRKVDASILVLSGTGSCCFGRNAKGDVVKVGGWGHLLGDKGSGYEIGLRGVKASVYYFDHDGEWPPLGQRILGALELNSPNDLIGWAQNADKSEIAALAIEVFTAAQCGDKIARDILLAASESLAEDAVACAKRLASRNGAVQFVFAGSVLLKQRAFSQSIIRRIKKVRASSTVAFLKADGVWGAVALARKLISAPSIPSPTSQDVTSVSDDTGALALSPTERRHPRSRQLDKLPVGRAINLMLSEDARLPGAILREKKKIEQAVNLIVASFKKGGRLIYIGAGTSGRLGVLDASECPPTFRTPPEMVQSIIAGGQVAIWKAVEGAEDDAAAGAEAIRSRGITKRDTVIGIAASGRTPFVLKGLVEARRRGARTVFLCFNPQVQFAPGEKPDLVIAPDIGPEILTGSTRLKAGTATKLILNIFTTLSMVRIGKVISNLMIDLNPSNVKLRDRAVRIIQQLTGADAGTAKSTLEKSGWVVKTAWQKLK